MLPLAVVGTVTALAAFGVGRTSLNAVLWLAVVVAAGVAWNFLVYWFRFGSATWGLLLPLAKPTGIDFRDGLYDPAAAFTTAHSGWPPLTLLLGRPFTLLGLLDGLRCSGRHSRGLARGRRCPQREARDEGGCRSGSLRARETESTRRNWPWSSASGS